MVFIRNLLVSVSCHVSTLTDLKKHNNKNIYKIIIIIISPTTRRLELPLVTDQAKRFTVSTNVRITVFII